MRLSGWLIVATTLVLVALVLFLVLDRVALGISFMGTHELALMAAMWLYMIGAVVAIRNRQHITVDYLAGRIVSPLGKVLHDLVIAVLMVVFALFFARLALDMIGWSIARPQRTPALGLSLMLSQAAIVVAAGLSIVYALRDFIAATLRLGALVRSGGSETAR
jgi:TRAP-type transport system small permease protein